MITSVRNKPFLIIFGLILLSSLLRLHAFINPVGGSHVWLSAHVVLTSSIWNTDGAKAHQFSPVYTFSESADKNMRTLASGISDNKGNFYYVSYPPFSFLLAYFFFKLFSLTPSLLVLQVVNIFLQWFTAYVIYLIVCELYHKKYTSYFYPGIIASALYIFSAQSMWCHVYMYFADTLIQVLWSISILVSFMIFQRGKVTSMRFIILLGCANFLSVYTEWLGLFFAVVIACYSAFLGTRKRAFFTVTVVVLISSLLAISLTVWQYSSVDGLQNLINASAEKYLDRSGISQNSLYYAQIDIQRILNHYWRLHKANIILLLFLSATLFILLKQLKYSKLKDHFYLTTITLAPILIHHAVFLEFSSMHDFSTLKSLIFFCFFTAYLYNILIYQTRLDPNSALFLQRLSVSLMIIILILNTLIYYSNINFSPQTIFSIASQQIATTSTQNDALYGSTRNQRENGIIVFMGGDRAFSPQIQLLTQRNILGVSGHIEAISHMKRYHNKHGILYTFDQYGRLVGIDSYTNPEEDL